MINTEINLPFLAYDSATGPKNLGLQLTRAKMEELLRPIIERCRGPTTQALQDAKLSPNDIDKIILIGGPTRMPMVRQFVATVMGKEPERGVDPMEAVALGARHPGSSDFRRRVHRYIISGCNTLDAWGGSFGWLKGSHNRTQYNNTYQKE